MNNVPRELRPLVESVEGWCPYWEGAKLWELARDAPEGGCIVEIGSWKGRSTCWLSWGSLASGKRNPPHVFAVDGFTDPSHGDDPHAAKDQGFSVFPEFCANIERAAAPGIVIPIPKWSADALEDWRAAPRPISLLFIDGLHTWEGVIEDFRWSDYVIPGGIIAFDDVRTKRFPDVDRFVREALPQHPGWEYLGEKGPEGRLVWGRWHGA